MTFTASNGITVYLGTLGDLKFDTSGVLLAFPGMYKNATREFFQHERDEELGRWRWPENPEYVIYPKVSGSVRVVEELTGQSGVFSRTDSSIDVLYSGAARAYFEAHPESKPWDGAKPDEIWAVTLHGVERPCRVLNPTYSEHELAFLPLNGTSPTWFVPSASVTAARRIWPES